MRCRAVAGPAFALASLFACAKPAPPPPPPPDAAAIRAALEKNIASFGPLAQAKNVDGLVAMFTPDATWILPNAATYVGKDAIAAGAKDFLASFDSFAEDSSGIDKLIVVNDSEAVTFSHAYGTSKAKGSKKTTQDKNPFADYWTKGADGQWRIAYEVNADGPIAAKKP